MKRILTAILCLAVPGLFFLNAWQGYRYNTLADQIAALEKQQKDLLEANRDTIGQIAYESSPERIAEKAAALGLAKPDPAGVTRLQVEPAPTGGIDAVMATAAARARFTFATLVSATRGRIVARPAGSEGVRSVTSDSRSVGEGSLFVALPGERTDGHRYLGQAAAAGAAALLVSDAEAAARADELETIAARYGTGIVAVADTLAGLQDLARAHMQSVPRVTRIAVTGSNGKTTTKEIIGAILGRSAPTAMNEGNLNSEVGLPLACCAIAAEHRYAVLEMGMNHVGEMDVLVDIARPDLALITNIGTAHIGLLGSQDAIAAEKKKVFSRFDGRQDRVPAGRGAVSRIPLRRRPGSHRLLRTEEHPGLRGE